MVSAQAKSIREGSEKSIATPELWWKRGAGASKFALDLHMRDELSNLARILFVGGCHLNGYPVGEEHAFTLVALGCLSEHGENTPNVLPLCNLRSGTQILAKCRELKPDAVVLQLGHYETRGQMREILGLRRSKEKVSTQGAKEGAPPRANQRYRPTLLMRFLQLRRVVAAGMVVALGRKRRMFDPAAIADSLDSILLSLKELPMRGIVLVGPFSVPDPVMRFLRRRALPVFEAAAKRNECTFVDVFSLLESYPKGKDFNANFADPLHLSVSGHQKVGVLVGAALKRVMEQSIATEAEPLMAAPIKEVAPAAGPRWAGQRVVALHS
ncbi:MAG: SGNH/GDSL hydrolase family protein [Terracidiphilus sp.]